MARFAGKKVSDFMSASNSPNFDALGDYTMRSRNKEQDMAWRAQAHVAKAGLAGVGNTQVAKFKGIADIASAEANAAAQTHNAAAAADAQTSNAMWGMIGNIAGAGIGAFGKSSGSWDSFTPKEQKTVAKSAGYSMGTDLAGLL